MIEVCLERALQSIHPEKRCNGARLERKLQQPTPGTQLYRFTLEQHSTGQIGTLTITAHHCNKYTYPFFTLPYAALHFHFRVFSGFFIQIHLCSVVIQGRAYPDREDVDCYYIRQIFCDASVTPNLDLLSNVMLQSTLD